MLNKEQLWNLFLLEMEKHHVELTLLRHKEVVKTVKENLHRDYVEIYKYGFTSAEEFLKTVVENYIEIKQGGANPHGVSDNSGLPNPV